SMCRKASGSSFATNMLVKAEDLTVTGGADSIKAYQSSVGEYRCFCSECGSPLYSKASARLDKVSVRCGTLDDAPAIRPSMHIHVASKAPWFEVLDALTQFNDEPES